jgi:hypothetical protein
VEPGQEAFESRRLIIPLRVDPVVGQDPALGYFLWYVIEDKLDRISI